MSKFEKALKAAAPWDIEIPAPLSEAWNFMESQGWTATSGDGTPVLTAYPDDRQLGPVFTVNPFAEGWVGEDDPEAPRLIVIAEGSNEGDEIAMWQDDEGHHRFVCLCSDAGKPARLADSPLEFLRLLAVGYDEWVETNFGAPPDVSEDWDPAVGAAEFRAWLTERYNVDVPEEWHVRVDSELTEWLDKHSPRR